MTFPTFVQAAIVVPSGVAISATNSGGGPTSVSITAGTYATLTALCAHIQSALQTQRAPSGGATWSVALSTTTGQVTIAVSSGTYSISWTSTALRDLLGFAGNISSQATATGTKQAKGVWRPDAVLRADVDVRRAPLATDHRTTLSPTGAVYALQSNAMYRHQNVRMTHVPGDRVWEAQATLPNASYETWIKDTQLGVGHAWFGLSSKITITDHAGGTVGADASISGWQIPQLPGLDTLVMSEGAENGLYYRVVWPELVSTG